MAFRAPPTYVRTTCLVTVRVFLLSRANRVSAVVSYANYNDDNTNTARAYNTTVGNDDDNTIITIISVRK